MTAKRFAGEFDNQYSGVYDDGKQLSNFEVVRLLNELSEENKELKKDIKQIHTYIDNAILTERTRMGKNCLKQLKEGLQ